MGPASHDGSGPPDTRCIPVLLRVSTYAAEHRPEVGCSQSEVEVVA